MAEYQEMIERCSRLLVGKGSRGGAYRRVNAPLLSIFLGKEAEEYQAYAYLVSTGEALTAETATAQVALTAGAAQTIDYSGDVNMSGKVDLNDAQLVYDLYNATYYDFSTVSMEKMLRADVSKDKKIDVSDVTAIVAIVRK